MGKFFIFFFASKKHFWNYFVPLINFLLAKISSSLIKSFQSAVETVLIKLHPVKTEGITSQGVVW